MVFPINFFYNTCISSVCTAIAQAAARLVVTANLKMFSVLLPCDLGSNTSTFSLTISVIVSIFFLILSLRLSGVLLWGLGSNCGAFVVLVCAGGLVDWLSGSPAGGVLAVAEGGDLGDHLSGPPVGVASAVSGVLH